MAREVEIATGKSNVQLPNGGVYDAGDVVVLTDAQYAQINQAFIPDTIIDNGVVEGLDDAVVTQAAVVTAPAALTSSAPAAVTSSQVATANGSDPTTTQALANALKVAYNAAQVDVAALRATLAAVQVDVAAIRTKQAAILTALKGTGKPMASA